MVIATQRELAAFDVDGTLVGAQTQALLVRFLTRSGLLPMRTRAAVAAWFIGYKLGFPVRPGGVRRRVLRSLRGMSAADVDDLANTLHREYVEPLISEKGTSAVRAYEERGVQTVLVSASIEPIVARIAREVGASGWIATQLKMEDGVLAGDIDGTAVSGAEKVRALAEWATARHQSWRLVAAYGDHESDVPMLESAEAAYAVNPSARLRAIALRKSWECLDWRSGVRRR